MPRYTVRNDQGREVTFDWHGEGEPTDADMEEVFASAGDAEPEDKNARTERQLREMGYGQAIDGILGGGVSSAAPTAVGKAVQQFAPGVSKALKGGAERLYGGLLKAKDSTIERFPTVVQDLLKARAPISQGGRAKVITGLKKVGAEKNALLQGADERAMVPREALRGGLDDSLDAAIANSETPVKDMGKLAKMEKELIPDEPGILPSRADRIKTKLQTEAQRGYLGNKTGAKVTDTAANAKMNVAGRAKGALEAIEPKLGPVNAAYASGKGQSIALRDALKRTEKHSPIGISDLLGAGVGTVAGGPIGGALGVGAMKALNHPNTGSRAAIYMNDAGRIPHLDQAMKAALLALLAEQE
jgi:hypothetical protein